MKFQGKLAYRCQKQLNMQGKKIPYARTKRKNNRNRLKDLCSGYVKAQRENNKATKRH